MDERSGSPRSRRDGSVDSEPRKPKMFGRKPRNNKNANIPANTTDRGRTVKQMPFTDQFGDYGTYTGYVNDDGRPEGKGSMKYDNGVFYEGTWTDGAQDKAAASQYERIRGGFTSWGGKGKQGSKSGMVLPWNARKNDGHNAQEKTNVRGMEWTDLNGDSGRYTGEVNDDRLPHGRGIMKYSFGLIAEGDWSNGVLKEGPQDRMISAAASMAGGGAGMSVGPGGMSVGPGGMSIGPGVTGGMSVGPMSVGPMSMGGPMAMGMPPMGMTMMPQPPMNPMMNNAAQHAMISQQNMLMRSMSNPMMGAGGSVYGGPPGMGMSVPHMQPMPMQQMMPMQPMPTEPKSEKPPVMEIKIDM